MSNIIHLRTTSLCFLSIVFQGFSYYVICSCEYFCLEQPTLLPESQLKHNFLWEAILVLCRDSLSGLPKPTAESYIPETLAMVSMLPEAPGFLRCLILFSTQIPSINSFIIYISFIFCINFFLCGEPWRMVCFILLEERSEAFLDIACLP